MRATAKSRIKGNAKQRSFPKTKKSSISNYDLTKSDGKDNLKSTKRRRLFSVRSKNQLGNQGRGKPQSHVKSQSTTKSKTRLRSSIRSSGINEEGLSHNHNLLPEGIRESEKASAERRQPPILRSQYDQEASYAEPQLIKKSFKHQDDNNSNEDRIPDDERSAEQLTNGMFYDSEDILGNRNVETYCGTFNLKEDVMFKLLRSEKAIAVFEDWPLYEGLDKKHFITTYKDPTGQIIQDIDSTINGISLDEASFTDNMRIVIDDQENTRTRGPNVGLSEVEREDNINQEQSQKLERLARKEQELMNHQNMYAQLKQDEKMSVKHRKKN